MNRSQFIAACLPSLCHACGELIEVAGTLRRFPLLCRRCRAGLRRCRGGSLLAPDLELIWPYRKGPVLGALIKGWKYSGRDAALPELAEALAQRLKAASPPRPWLLQPVPMPFFRRLSRGFNQSALLAEAVARHCDAAAPLNLLRRDAWAGRQAGRSRRERLVRAAREYSCSHAPPPEGSLILVDDLCTTGATLLACWRSLGLVPGRKAYALVLTRISCPTATLDRSNPP